jgi:hypothetical protein
MKEECRVTRVTQQTINHNGRSRTATSRIKQQARTKSPHTAAAGARSCVLRHASEHRSDHTAKSHRRLLADVVEEGNEGELEFAILRRAGRNHITIKFKGKLHIVDT